MTEDEPFGSEKEREDATRLVQPSLETAIPAESDRGEAKGSTIFNKSEGKKITPADAGAEREKHRVHAALLQIPDLKKKHERPASQIPE